MLKLHINHRRKVVRRFKEPPYLIYRTYISHKNECVRISIFMQIENIGSADLTIPIRREMRYLYKHKEDCTDEASVNREKTMRKLDSWTSWTGTYFK